MKKVTVEKLTIDVEKITDTLNLGDSDIYVRPMNNDDFNWFSNCHPHHIPLGFLVTPFSSRVILKMKPDSKRNYTPYLCVRDCGDHYIVAEYAEYVRIDKETGKRTYDVEDM